MKHPNGKSTAERYLRLIQSKLPHITQLRGFATTRSKCECFDVRDGGGWFATRPSDLMLGYCSGHPKLKPSKRRPLGEVLIGIAAKYPYIQYLGGYVGVKAKCQFLDKRVNEVFETTPNRILIGQCTGAKGVYKKTADKWTKELVLSEAKKYPSISEWQLSASGCYKAALRYGWFDEASKHMKRPVSPNLKWTKETVIQDAQKYSSRKEWEDNSHAYTVAYQSGILDEACSHMPRLLRAAWTKEEVMREALKYQSIAEWRRHNGGSYSAAWANGWLPEAAKHMTKGYTTSAPEKNLLSIILEYYPKASKATFGTKRGIGNSFELDIYIPELRKGIEFNGDYFHSEAGLKRSRPNWPDDMIKNYHNLKKEFFQKRGIEYLEIWESEWKEDKGACMQHVRMFLGL